MSYIFTLNWKNTNISLFLFDLLKKKNRPKIQNKKNNDKLWHSFFYEQQEEVVWVRMSAPDDPSRKPAVLGERTQWGVQVFTTCTSGLVNFESSLWAVKN